MMAKIRGETAELQRLDQIPTGTTEEETARFWETHSLGDALLDQMEPFPDDFPLPPRAELPETTRQETADTGQSFPVRKILFGIVAIGLVAVSAYVVYRMMKSGIDLADFAPTKVDYLKISQPLAQSVKAAANSSVIRAIR